MKLEFGPRRKQYVRFSVYDQRVKVPIPLVKKKKNIYIYIYVCNVKKEAS